MHLIEFDRNAARWDLFNAPHVSTRSFISFASGEVIYTDPAPRDRRWNRELGVQIVATGDDDCPPLYLDPKEGEPVAKACLTQRGIQYLAIDHEQGVAVRLIVNSGYRRVVAGKPVLRDADHFAPHYLTGRFAAYWAGPGRKPIGDPITVSEAYRPTREEKQHLQDLKDQATVWAAMMNLPEYAYLGGQNVPNQHEAHFYFDKKFTDLTEPMKKSLHYYGWANFRVETKHPYLYVRSA